MVDVPSNTSDVADSPLPQSPAQAVPEDWVYVACPLCGSRRHELVFQAENKLYDTRACVTLRRCECGLTLTNPQPTQALLASFYQTAGYYTHAVHVSLRDRIRLRLHRSYIGGRLGPIRKRLEDAGLLPPFLKRMALTGFQLRRGLWLLDFGCGCGWMLRIYEDLGLFTVGIEPDPLARESARAFGLRVLGSLGDLDGPLTRPQDGRAVPHRFDRILLSHVLEHLPEPLEVLRRLADRLDPHGRMFISVPNVESKQARVLGSFWIGYDMPRHLWHFAPSTLERLVTKAGLAIVSVATVELPAFHRESNALRIASGEPEIEYEREWRAVEAAGQGAEIVLIATHAL